MEKNSKKEKERKYLDTNIFYDLLNLNTGFDSPNIKYFSEADFEIVLDRVQRNGIGIWGIEPWQHGEFYEVTCCRETDDPTDPAWYFQAFQDLKMMREILDYSATYSIPKRLLNNY